MPNMDETGACRRRRQPLTQPSVQASIEYLAHLSTSRATDIRQPCGTTTISTTISTIHSEYPKATGTRPGIVF